MKLPQTIKGPNKIRTVKMIKLYLDGKTMLEIGTIFGISGSRVQQILYKNRDLLESDRKYEKAVRINRLKRWIEKHPETSKDAIDIQAELRKEIEGDKPNIAIQNTVANYTYGWRNDSHRDSLRTTTISESNPQ